MTGPKESAFWRVLLPFVVAAGALLATPVQAQDGGVDLLSGRTLDVYGDVRAVAVDGEPSWVNEGFGKLRYGGGSAPGETTTRLRAEFGEAGLVWRPQLGWALSGTVVALAQGNGGDAPDAGLSEAYLTFKPLSQSPLRISARAGLMWPPISMEHSGPEWAVSDLVTPSAIGSWIGEEVKVLGVELTGKYKLGDHDLALTAAVFDGNDTAGTLLAFRGWALHDRKALAFRRAPLPPLNDFISYVQPRYTHQLLDADPGVLKRPGFYAKLAWSTPWGVQIEAVHYDNNADPLAVTPALEWGWRTRFNTLGLFAALGDSTEVRLQGLSGRTRMGGEEAGVTWIDTRFRAGYAMATHRFGRASLSTRVDVFGTRNRGSELTAADDEDGWAVTFGGKRSLGPHLTALVEYLHVHSSRLARARARLDPNQSQDQLQLVLRAKL